MKRTQHFIILLNILFMSCGQNSEEESFREKIDKIKKDDVPNMDFTLSMYASDSSKYWKILSEITQKQQSGSKSTIINTEFRKNDTLVKEVKNDLKQKMQFQGQVIATDHPDEVSLFYLLVDETNQSIIYKVTYETSGQSKLEKLDSTKSSDWEKTKLLITSKHQ